jgi:hypothetical protein
MNGEYARIWLVGWLVGWSVGRSVGRSVELTTMFWCDKKVIKGSYLFRIRVSFHVLITFIVWNYSAKLNIKTV